MRIDVLPDRYQRAALLAGTAGLPRPARVAARRRALGAFQARLTARADAVIVVHPKSGGSWLRTMIFRVYQQQYALPSRRVVKTDELARARAALPRFVISNGWYTYESAVARVLERDGAAPTKRLLLLARHPGDIVVSWYRQFTRRISPRKRELIVADLREPVDYRRIGLWEFVMHPELGLPALIDYHNRWADFFADYGHGLIVRYEDLRAEPHRYLAAVIAHLGENVSDARIDEAVAFASFDHMRRLEAERYFPNSSLRQKKRGDAATVKVRRGEVGAFRQDLTPAQVKVVDSMVRQRLDPVFGYGRAGADT